MVRRLVNTLLVFSLLLHPRHFIFAEDAYPITGEYHHGGLPKSLLMRVKVWGAIPTTGVHYVPKGSDLLTVISYAGAPTENAEDDVYIRRLSGSKYTLLEFNMEDISEKPYIPFLEILPEDVIVVQRKTYWISDNVLKTVAFFGSILAMIGGSLLIYDRLK